MQTVAQAINILARFCGPRDVEPLTRAALRAAYGFDRADVMVLFGGSILAGGDVLARAIREEVAQRYVIVGGAGHTTETLRRRVHGAYPQIETDGLPEAEIFQRYLQTVHGVQADWLETQSTNCGNNITYLLELLHRHGMAPRHMILCQDATMQRRMEAGLRRQVGESLQIIQYAAYRTETVMQNGQPVFADPPHGMWEMDRYVELLMGEIPRLRNDENGYGPRGKGFIAPVEIPPRVEEAFALLQQVYGCATRPADPRFASRP